MRLFALLALLFTVSLASAMPPKAEIEALLAHLKGLDGAIFIRNGGEHSASEAEAHLRMKWEKQNGKIATAEDFIELCGSKSSMSGERYRIRFKDGQVRFSNEVLTAQLKLLRNKNDASSQ